MQDPLLGDEAQEDVPEEDFQMSASAAVFIPNQNIEWGEVAAPPRGHDDWGTCAAWRSCYGAELCMQDPLLGDEAQEDVPEEDFQMSASAAVFIPNQNIEWGEVAAPPRGHDDWGNPCAAWRSCCGAELCMQDPLPGDEAQEDVPEEDSQVSASAVVFIPNQNIEWGEVAAPIGEIPMLLGDLATGRSCACGTPC